MPGLFGIVGKNSDKINQMSNVLTHYNWQKIEVKEFYDEKISFGRIFLDNGFNQSKQFFDNDIFILLQGFIFLKNKNDPITNPNEIIKIFRKKGLEFLDEIQTGIFNIVIFNQIEKKIIIINDRFGLYPLFYYQNNNELIFSPEIKAILKCEKSNNFEINYEAISEFFYFGFLTGEKTYFKKIKLLTPASILEYDIEKNKFKIKKYWKPTYNENQNDNLSEKEIVNRLFIALKKSVNKSNKLKSKIGQTLSGGLDSRTIYALFEKKINTYTYGFPWSSDVRYTKELLKIKNNGKNYIWTFKSDILKKTSIENNIITENLAGIGNSYIIDLGKRIRKNNEDIILDGYLGDVLFGGTYFKSNKNILNKIIDNVTEYKQIPMQNENKIIEKIYNNHVSIQEEFLANNLSESFFKKIRNKSKSTLQKEINNEKFEFNHIKYVENFYDIFKINNSRGRRFIKVGGIVLNNFVETIYPFFDYEVFDVYLKIKPNLRYNHKIYYSLYKEHFKEFSNIPSTVSKLSAKTPIFFHFIYKQISIILKEKIFGKIYFLSKGKLCDKKDSYVDYDRWIREDKELENWLYDIIINGNSTKDGLFNKENLKKIFDKHMNYKLNYAKYLLRFASFEIWYSDHIKYFNKERKK